MEEYFDNLNDFIKEYFSILSEDFPEFLYDYINTKPMMRLDGVSALVGWDYTSILNIPFKYTSLTHSIGVALIIWHFTHDKKQTLSGLFHDIATPAFKHCIDFLNKDYETQESTEELTTDIIKNSDEIMSLLKRDGITLDEVKDYKIYPIADNNTPKLSADRLEYTFSDGFTMTHTFGLEKIRRTYNNIKVLKNEEGIEEIGFTDVKIAEEFEEAASKLWFLLQENGDKLKTQFLADIVKLLNERDKITLADLYNMSEDEIINLIRNSEFDDIKLAFEKFNKTTKYYEGENPPKENYYTVSLNVKKRYIIPLVNDKRVVEVSKETEELINKYKTFKSPKYGWFNFNI